MRVDRPGVVGSGSASLIASTSASAKRLVILARFVARAAASPGELRLSRISI
jgi:hypothetical protein